MDRHVQRSDRVAFRETRDGGVLLHLDTGRYHSVNRLGRLVWSMLDGRTLSQIVTEIRSELDDAPPEVVDDVRAFVDDLVARDLATYESP